MGAVQSSNSYTAYLFYTKLFKAFIAVVDMNPHRQAKTRDQIILLVYHDIILIAHDITNFKFNVFPFSRVEAAQFFYCHIDQVLVQVNPKYFASLILMVFRNNAVQRHCQVTTITP